MGVQANSRAYSTPGRPRYQTLIEQGTIMAAPAPHNTVFVILVRAIVWVVLLMLLISRGVSPSGLSN